MKVNARILIKFVSFLFDALATNISAGVIRKEITFSLKTS